MRWSLSRRRFRGLLVVVGLVLACGREGAVEADRPAGIQTRAVATSLPAGASVVVSGHDLQGFWTRLEATQLFRQMQSIPDVRQAFAPLAETQQDFESQTGLPLNEETLMALFGEKFDLGYYGPLGGDRADLLLVADVAEEARALEILQALESRVGQEENASFADREIAGATVRVATTEEGDLMFYVLEGGALTIATTQDRIASALGLGSGEAEIEPMSEAEEYVEVLRKLPDATIAVYVDQRAVTEAARRAAADTTAGATPEERLQRERLAAATSALEGVDLVRSMALGLYWVDEGIRADAYAQFAEEGERSELVEMLTRPPSEIRSIGFQPVGTLLYGALNSLNANAIYNSVREYAVDATRIQMGVKNTPDSLRADSMVQGQIARFEQQTGIDVEEDILSWMGGEAAFALTGVDRTGFFPVPETAFTVATRDAARTRAFFTELEGVLSQMAMTRASIPLSWQSEEHQGQTIRYAPTPFGEGLSVAYAVTDEFAILASSRGLARRMLEAGGGGASALPSNPNFGAMTEFYPAQVNALGFVNLEQILTEVQSLMSTYGQMAGAPGVADTTATAHRVVAALKNAPRMGFYSTADEEGVLGHFLLEVR